jgi:hypothetical protein
MAYFERFSGTEHKPGLVTFERVGTFSDGTPHYRQCEPWCWAPWAMGQPCDGCGRSDSEVAAARDVIAGPAVTLAQALPSAPG